MPIIHTNTPNICRVRTRDVAGNYYTYIVVAENLGDAEVKIKAYLEGTFCVEEVLCVENLPIPSHGVAVVDAHLAEPAPF